MMFWIAQAQFIEQYVFDYFDTFQQFNAINFAKGIMDQGVKYFNNILTKV